MPVLSYKGPIFLKVNSRANLICTKNESNLLNERACKIIQFRHSYADFKLYPRDTGLGNTKEYLSDSLDVFRKRS